MPSKNPTVGWKLPPELAPEWATWELIAKAAGLSMRDWMVGQVRAALQAAKAPKSRTLGGPAVAEQRWAEGLLCGRLDALFCQGRPEDIAVDWVWTWAARYPGSVPNVVQWCTYRPYGTEFSAWWRQRVAPGLPSASGRTPA